MEKRTSANGDKDGAPRPPKKPRKAIASGVFGTLNPPPRKAPPQPPLPPRPTLP